jgi:hypothetical protein
MIFKSYKEAHDKLKIPGSYQRGTHGTIETGITSLKITAHPDSYDKILDNGNTIYYVGKGNKTTPAHPVRNQNTTQQDVFRTSIKTGNIFPVLYKENNTVKLLGKYKIVDLKKSFRKESLIGVRVYFYYAILKRITAN